MAEKDKPAPAAVRPGAPDEQAAFLERAAAAEQVAAVREAERVARLNASETANYGMGEE